MLGGMEPILQSQVTTPRVPYLPSSFWNQKYFLPLWKKRSSLLLHWRCTYVVVSSAVVGLAPEDFSYLCTYMWTIDFPVGINIGHYWAPLRRSWNAGIEPYVCRCIKNDFTTQSGLPDFSWYNKPKWGKYIKMVTKSTKCP
jgi:hypothetical protein